MLPTTTDRRSSFYELLKEICFQIKNLNPEFQQKIELLIDEDNKEKSIGKKRQDLLLKSRGTWVVGIDSDDTIAKTYLKDIVNALNANPNTDHVGFLESCSINGVLSVSLFSIRYKKWAENIGEFDHIRCANPKSVIRRVKALQAGFSNIRFGEDKLFSERVTPLLRSEIFINKPLYMYRYVSSGHKERYGIK
jgi:hypothetical protein